MNYIIQGGIKGRERLKVLHRVMLPTTQNLLDNVGVKPGDTCLDVGCGSGYICFELAKRVGETGNITGLDMDSVKVELATQDANEKGIKNVEFISGDINTIQFSQKFDVIYSRFLLSHLPDAAQTIKIIATHLKPGGVFIAEDVDFNGHFCYPPSEVFNKYVDLYIRAGQHAGADPLLGTKLPALFAQAGLRAIENQVVQPAGLSGDVKLMAAITMENIAASVLAAQLATQEEITEIINGLYSLANDERVFMSIPRVVQVWGRNSNI